MVIDERLGDFVGDERKIKQILLNLLSNAVKLTPEGGRIGIDVRQSNGSVEVWDRDRSWSAEDQLKALRGICQEGSDSAHKSRGNRTGINLARSRRAAWG